MKSIAGKLALFSGQGLEEHRSWYSQASKAYDTCRPKYPPQIINEALRVANNPRTVLEVGCGLGTATVALAERGLEIVAGQTKSRFLPIGGTIHFCLSRQSQNCQLRI